MDETAEHRGRSITRAATRQPRQATAWRAEETMKLVLKSIEEEAADCRIRCAHMEVGDLVLHCHHEILCEILTEPIENRIDYILKSKEDNVALRLRLMGPPIEDAAVHADAEWSKADAEWSKADAELSKARAEWSKADVELSKAYAESSKAYAELSKADAEWWKAYAEWSKARPEFSKADAEWWKAYAELSKADVESSKADAEWWKADAELSKARAESSKAYAELSKAYAEWSKAYEPHYARLYPDSPWNGKTIFAGEFAL